MFTLTSTCCSYLLKDRDIRKCLSSASKSWLVCFSLKVQRLTWTVVWVSSSPWTQAMLEERNCQNLWRHSSVLWWLLCQTCNRSVKSCCSLRDSSWQRFTSQMTFILNILALLTYIILCGNCWAPFINFHSFIHSDWKESLIHLIWPCHFFWQFKSVTIIIQQTWFTPGSWREVSHDICA